MSVRVMTVVWQLQLPAYEKLLLLALADNANDEGECFPSINTLVAKSGISERVVQRKLTVLRNAGHIECHFRTGRSTWYTIHPRHSDTPERATPPSQRHPTPVSQTSPPPSASTRTPVTATPITSKKPSIEPSPNHQGVVLHESLPKQEWDEWLTLRRKRRWPTDELTLRKQLAVLAPYDTLTQSEIINRSIQAGWQGLFAPKATGPPRKKYVPAPTVAELEAEEAARARSG
jgi:Helix-turn-helix domain